MKVTGFWQDLSHQQTLPLIPEAPPPLPTVSSFPEDLSFPFKPNQPAVPLMLLVPATFSKLLPHLPLPSAVPASPCH